jgi:predicted DsbA family dithiol-disulfide isomerase
VLPNTAAAHNLVGFVAASGTDAQRAVLVDTLFTAYFMEGENIGDYGTLEHLGLECAPQPGLKEHLEESRRTADQSGRRIPRSDPHVSGVPHFVFNSSYSLSRAQSPDVIVSDMQLAASTRRNTRTPDVQVGTVD